MKESLKALRCRSASRLTVRKSPSLRTRRYRLLCFPKRSKHLKSIATSTSRHRRMTCNVYHPPSGYCAHLQGIGGRDGEAMRDSGKGFTLQSQNFIEPEAHTPARPHAG